MPGTVRAAVGLGAGGAAGPLDGAEDVRLVGLLLPVDALVTERGVEVPAAVVVRAPRDRVVVGGGRAVLLVVGVLVELEEDVDVLGLGGEVVPLVGPHPVGRRQVPGGRMRGVDDVDRRLLELDRRGRVVEEPRAAHHVALPRPVAVGVGVGVDAHDAAAALRPALERVALSGVQDALAVRVEEDDHLVRAQPGVRELRLVLGRGYREVIRDAHRRDLLLAGVDRGRMTEAGRSREDQHVEGRSIRRPPQRPAPARRPAPTR